SNFLGNDEVTNLSRRWQRSDMNVHHLDKRSQWLAVRIFLPNFHGRTNVTKVGDLHEAMLQSMTEDRSFDDVLPAYKTFANNVMLLQGTRLVHYNWDRFKLQVHDLETLDAFIEAIIAENRPLPALPAVPPPGLAASGASDQAQPSVVPVAYQAQPPVAPVACQAPVPVP
ncbi:unnamed protein product, partial [Durusdinium trenchii]